MGRINTRYIIYIIKNKFLRFLPYKARKPFLLIFTIIGLYGYFKFMLVLSTNILGSPSIYLLTLQSVATKIINNLTATIGWLGTTGVFVILLICLLYKYTIPLVKKEDRKKDEYYPTSLYHEINSIISIMYLVITVLAFLPVVIK